MLNVEKIREDFPVLKRKIRNKPIIYLDNSCMALKPKQVIDAMNRYYYEFPACGGRSIHTLGEEVSEAYESARKTFAKFIGAETNEIIWTRNATESINLVANALEFKKGDKIISTTLEHHSGVLPFYKLQKTKGVKLELVSAKSDGTFDIADWEKAIDDNTRLVSVVHASNVTGTVAPLEEIIKIAHEHNALVLSDDAQFAPHHPMNVKNSNVDFSAISIHKMLGPSGMGALYGKRKILEEMDTFLVGGDTISDVILKENNELEVRFLPPPEKYEAGLQNYAGVIGAGAAAEYIMKIGIDKIEEWEQKLSHLLADELQKIDKIHIIGPTDDRRKAGLVTFTVEGISSAHDVAIYLDQEYNIMVRSGAHCVNPFHYQIGIKPGKGTTRASAYLYNTEEEIYTLVEALKKLVGN